MTTVALLETNPKTLAELAKKTAALLPDASSYDKLASIELTGVSITSVVSVLAQKPFFIIRKESKGYGTKKLVEGKLDKSDRVVLITDSTDGLESHIQSVLETQDAKLVQIVHFNGTTPEVKSLSDFNV